MPDRVSSFLLQWQRERPDLDLLPMGVSARLTRASHLIAVGVRAFFAEHDLQPGEFNVLQALRRAGAPYTLTPGALTSGGNVTAAAMSNRLTRLEAKGLVDRVTDPENRRSVLVTLTAAGLTLIEALAPVHAQRERDLLGALERNELEQLSALLEKLLVGLGDGPVDLDGTGGAIGVSD